MIFQPKALLKRGKEGDREGVVWEVSEDKIEEDGKEQGWKEEAKTIVLQKFDPRIS